MFAPEGLPTGSVAETKIYQNFKEQKGTLLKDEDIYIVTKLSGFSGEFPSHVEQDHSSAFLLILHL